MPNAFIGGFVMQSDAARIDNKSQLVREALYEFAQNAPLAQLDEFRSISHSLLDFDYLLYEYIKLIDFVHYVDSELGPLPKTPFSMNSLKDDHSHNLYALIASRRGYEPKQIEPREINRLKAEYLVKALNFASGHGGSQQNLYGAQYNAGLALLMDEAEPAVPALLALARKARTRVIPVIEMRRLTGYVKEHPDDLPAICNFLESRGFFDRGLMDSVLTADAPAVMNGVL